MVAQRQIIQSESKKRRLPKLQFIDLQVALTQTYLLDMESILIELLCGRNILLGLVLIVVAQMVSLETRP